LTIPAANTPANTRATPPYHWITPFNQTGVTVPKMDGIATFEQLAQQQLKNNKLPPTGTSTMPKTK